MLTRPIATSILDNPAGTASTAPGDRLAVRERTLRLIGEVVLFLGTMALLAGLYLTRQISGFEYLHGGLIHLPDVLVGGYDYAKPAIEMRVLPEFRNTPAGNVLFGVILLFAVFSALLRKRTVITWVFLVFCILPWPLVGLMVPGTSSASMLVLSYKFISSIRQRNFRKAVIFAACMTTGWMYFSLDQMDLPRSDDRRAVLSNTAMLQTAPGARLKTFADMRVSSSEMAGAKAYALAQEGFFRNDVKTVERNLGPAMDAFSVTGSIERNRLLALQNYLAAQGIGQPAVISAYQSRSSAYRIGSFLLFILAAVGILLGSLIEMLAGQIVKRTLRIEAIREKLAPMKAGERVARDDLSGMSPEAASVRRLKRRAVWMGMVATPFAIAAAAAAVVAWYLSVPQASSYDGFSLVHILPPAFSNFPKGYLNVSPDELNFLVLPSPLMAMVPYVCFIALIVLLALRKYRYVRILLGCAVLYGFYAYFGVMRTGLIELPIQDIKAATIVSLKDQLARVASDSARSVVKERDARDREAYAYVLAQVAYLAGDQVETAGRLRAMGVPQYWDIPSVQWRLAIMKEWLAANGMALKADARPFVSPDVFRGLSSNLLLLALGFMGLGMPFAGLAALLLFRKRRVEAFVAEIRQQILVRKAGLMS